LIQFESSINRLEGPPHLEKISPSKAGWLSSSAKVMEKAAATTEHRDLRVLSSPKLKSTLRRFAGHRAFGLPIHGWTAVCDVKKAPIQL
jgi:hypothetical protein